MLLWTAGGTDADRTGCEKSESGSALPRVLTCFAESALDGTVTFCAPINTVCKVGLGFAIPEKRPKEWPKQRWQDTLYADLKHVGVQPDQTHD
ncbi:hypothetical protein Y032_0167g116 [Ancylostoma ceylanicum]|uniref:Uncharacterized protein n=1 Tax=Ancylostoma ceylanicum TaxID=53326 RepID=A0A016SVL9_9BILA|nr:hypothetical protein Y032_0167g116 [Ancylostoma ceylanicum]